jgi:putative ABC transport system substrate-binding protein
MTTRRELVLALGAGMLTALFASHAQQARPKLARIGLLEASSASVYTNRREALIAGLRELGLVEGKNISIEYRGAEGKYERLPGLAAELVQMKVDVIVAIAAPATRAAQQATTTIPIVMVGASDPVGSGLVASKRAGSLSSLRSTACQRCSRAGTMWSLAD